MSSLLIAGKNNEIRVVYLIAFTFVAKIIISSCLKFFTIYSSFYFVPEQALLLYGIKKPGYGALEGKMYLKD